MDKEDDEPYCIICCCHHKGKMKGLDDYLGKIKLRYDVIIDKQIEIRDDESVCHFSKHII